MTTVINEEEIEREFRTNVAHFGNASGHDERNFRAGARWAEKVATDRLIERAAMAVYEEWKDQPGYVPWVLAGNSHKQDDARRLARKALLEDWK